MANINDLYDAINAKRGGGSVTKVVLAGGDVNPQNRLLWSGGWYMNQSQTINLPEPISSQRTGIVLAWSYFDKASATPWDDQWSFFFVPKGMIGKVSGDISIPMSLIGGHTSHHNMSKLVYVNDTQIKGIDTNQITFQNAGSVWADNDKFVLRYVFGV